MGGKVSVLSVNQQDLTMIISHGYNIYIAFLYDFLEIEIAHIVSNDTFYV